MAVIATINGQLAIMEMDDLWEPGIPMVSAGPFTQADQQQLLWGFPEILWAAGTGPTIVAFWCGLTGVSGMTAGGDILVLGG